MRAAASRRPADALAGAEVVRRTGRRPARTDPPRRLPRRYGAAARARARQADPDEPSHRPRGAAHPGGAGTRPGQDRTRRRGIRVPARPGLDGRLGEPLDPGPAGQDPRAAREPRGDRTVLRSAPREAPPRRGPRAPRTADRGHGPPRAHAPLPPTP